MNVPLKENVGAGIARPRVDVGIDPYGIWSKAVVGADAYIRPRANAVRLYGMHHQRRL
ncbi:MAG: hypothetical protein IJD63_01430 [Oscillospiraceae bacterium]|nr:hypothetical protein [Oscillospiraceae bacterium]